MMELFATGLVAPAVASNFAARPSAMWRSCVAFDFPPSSAEPTRSRAINSRLFASRSCLMRPKMWP